jgi:hypothetical protein
MHSVDATMMDPLGLSLTAELVAKGKPTDDGRYSRHIEINKDAGRKDLSQISCYKHRRFKKTRSSLWSGLERGVLQVPFRVRLVQPSCP